MRIHAKEKGGNCWFVWDCERCLSPRYVEWVDDESAQWGSFVLNSKGRPAVVCDALVRETRQERRIDIFSDKYLVLFNQIEDVDADAVPRELALIEGPR